MGWKFIFSTWSIPFFIIFCQYCKHYLTLTAESVSVEKFSFDFQRDGNSYFPQRNEHNLKGNFCFVLKKSLKVCFGQTTYFQELSNQFILQTLNSGKSQPNKATLNQVSMFISILHKIILKIFSKVWICLRFWRQMEDSSSMGKTCKPNKGDCNAPQH